MSKNDSVVKQENSVFAGEQAQVALEILRENFGGKTPETSDFDSIRVPSGGGQQFSVTTLDGDEEKKELVGIIVGFFDSRAYWKDDFGGESGPPDCASSDCETGVGSPGGNCSTCPLSEFESAKNGKSQACKAMRTLFFIEADKYLPVIIVAPPTSIRNVKKYFLRLASAGLRFCSVVTRISLSSEKNSSGIKYSAIQLNRVMDLSPEEADNAKNYAALLKGKV